MKLAGCPTIANINRALVKGLLRNLADERCDRMKNWDISSSETRREPSHRRVVLVDSTRPIVPHPPSRLSRMSRLPLACTSRGVSIMQEAALLPLATWQNFYVIVGTAAATLKRDCGLQHPQRLPFWRRATGRCDSQRTLAGALECWPAARSFGSRRGDLHPHRALAGTPPSRGISTGAGRLAVVYGLAAGLLHRPCRRGDGAPKSPGAGSVRHRCRNDAAPVHRHPQRVGCRDLHCLRTLPAPEHEPGLAGVSRRFADAWSSAVGTRSVGRPCLCRVFNPDPRARFGPGHVPART